LSDLTALDAQALFCLALIAILATVMWVDIARALRTGCIRFRIGKWHGLREDPITRRGSPIAFWVSIVWAGIWAGAFAFLALGFVFNDWLRAWMG